MHFEVLFGGNIQKLYSTLKFSIDEKKRIVTLMGKDTSFLKRSKQTTTLFPRRNRWLRRKLQRKKLLRRKLLKKLLRRSSLLST
jgi:hypothetical protein